MNGLFDVFAGFRFENPWAFLAIPLVAMPVALLMYLRRKNRVSHFAFPSLSKAAAMDKARLLDSGFKAFYHKTRPAAAFVILTLIVCALARPQVKEKEITINREGVDIVVLFDISTSMMAADFKPIDRFSVARETIKEFVKGRKNDRVGLVVFAADAFTQAPLTSDSSIILNLLDSVKMGVIEDGTAIGNAIATGINRLRESKAKSKAMILLTDGDNNRGNIAPQEAAKMAAEYKIKIYTIQVGKGGLVDYPVDGFFGKTYQKVQIDVNPELLRDIADATGGRYFVATDAGTLERVFKLIDALEKTPLPEPDFVLYREKYSWFALPAFVLIILDLLMSLLFARRIYPA